MEYEVKFIRVDENAILPTKGSEKAAGFDLYATQRYVVPFGSRILVRTGWRVSPPPGAELQIRPRSGLALKHGITVLNTPGTIDEDYTGELGVVLFNTTHEDFQVSQGMRVAQMVVKPVIYASCIEVDEFEVETERGDLGFGSTGLT